MNTDEPFVRKTKKSDFEHAKHFVKEHWENTLAQYIRKSWGTIKDLEKAKWQKTLGEFED